MMWQLLCLLGYHSPKKNFRLERNDGQRRAICVYCHREIVKERFKWRVSR